MPAGAVLRAATQKDVKTSPFSMGGRSHSSAGDPPGGAAEPKAPAAAGLGSVARMLQTLRSFRQVNRAPAKAAGPPRHQQGHSVELPGNEPVAAEARRAEATGGGSRHSIAGGCSAAAASGVPEASFWEALELSEGGGSFPPASDTRLAPSRSSASSIDFLQLADDIASASCELSTSLSLRASSLRAHAVAHAYPLALHPSPLPSSPAPPARLSSSGGSPAATGHAWPGHAPSLTAAHANASMPPSPTRLSSSGVIPPIKSPAAGPSRAVSFKHLPDPSADATRLEDPPAFPSRLSTPGPSRGAPLKVMSVSYEDFPSVEEPLPPACTPSRLSASGGGLPCSSPGAAGPSCATSFKVSPTPGLGTMHAARHATALEPDLLPHSQPLLRAASHTVSPPTTPTLSPPLVWQREGGAPLPLSPSGRRPSLGGSLPHATSGRQPSLSGSLPRGGNGLAGDDESSRVQRSSRGLAELYSNLWGDEEPALVPSSRASTNGILDSHGELAAPQRGGSLRNMMLADCGGAPAAPSGGHRRSLDMGSMDRAHAPPGSLMAVSSMRKRASMLADMASLPGMPLVGGEGGLVEPLPDWSAFP